MGDECGDNCCSLKELKERNTSCLNLVFNEDVWNDDPSAYCRGDMKEDFCTDPNYWTNTEQNIWQLIPPGVFPFFDAGKSEIKKVLTKSFNAQTASCRNNCGQNVSLAVGGFCYCDDICETYSDCCPDVRVCREGRKTTVNRLLKVKRAQKDFKSNQDLFYQKETQYTAATIPIKDLSWCIKEIRSDHRNLNDCNRICCFHPRIFSKTNIHSMKRRCCNLGVSTQCDKSSRVLDTYLLSLSLCELQSCNHYLMLHEGYNIFPT